MSDVEQEGTFEVVAAGEVGSVAAEPVALTAEEKSDRAVAIAAEIARFAHELDGRLRAIEERLAAAFRHPMGL